MSSTLESFEETIVVGCPPPILKISLPFTHRLNCFIRLWLFKAVASIVFAIVRLYKPLPKSLQPTFVKAYAVRPYLTSRFYFPPNYQSGDVLPLYLNIHGGGFALCDPQNDDEFCASWARRTGMLVVSLDYRKAPLYPFPTAVYDIAALVNAVLEDKTLPMDISKVIIGGFSAGGNLALCAAQLPGLKGIIKAAIPFYPIVDWSHPPDEKLARRPYKDGPKDSLAESAFWFDWGYVSVGENRCNPLLSPCFAGKDNLPPWIYMIGAQWDMLRLEAQKMIHELADLEAKQDQAVDFEKDTYKWTLARGMPHGFTHQFGKNVAQRAQREKASEEIYAEAHEWLLKGALAVPNK